MKKMNKMKKVEKHLKGDMKMFKHEAKEDRKLIKAIKKQPKMKKKGSC